MKRIVSLVLSFVMLLTLCNAMIFTSFAEDEVFTATVQGTYEQSESEQDIVVRLELPSVTENYAAFYINGGIVLPDGFAIKSFTTNNSVQIQAADYSVKTGRLNYDPVNSQNSIPAGTYYDVIITAPANAVGDYEITINSLCATDAAYDPIVSMATLSATLTITEPQGYTAQLSTLSNSVAKNEQVTVNVGVSHSSDTYFNAAELVIDYDQSKLEVVSVQSSSNATQELKYTDVNGKITIEEFGGNKGFGTSNYTVTFKAIETGDALVKLESAKFVRKDDADKSDLIDATKVVSSLTLTITQQTYAVTLPEDGKITGNSVAGHGDDYTFTVAEYSNYTYTPTVKVNGSAISSNLVTYNGSGKYTVAGTAITGPVEITYTRQANSYNVIWYGTGSDDVADKDLTAIYGEDFKFKLPADKTATDAEDGYYYTVQSITIDGVQYNGYSVNEQDREHTIPGSAITGVLVITINKITTSTEKFSVTKVGNAAGDATVSETPIPKFGTASITINPEISYKYTVAATVGGVTATVNQNGNTYSVSNVTGNVIFTVTKALITDTVEVSTYVTLSGQTMYLVTYDVALDGGKVPTYGGENNVMFYSEKYGAYCWLVIANDLTVATAKSNIGAKQATATNVDYSMDINNTGKIDAADAQVVWNMYNAEYDDFSDVTMAQFLAADQVTSQKGLNVSDALAIVTAILDGTAQ